MTEREVLKLALEALENNRQTHHYCEDTWYSCPKHEDGCANDSEGDECNCGADKANAEIDAAITAIKEALAQPKQEPVEASKKDKVFDASIEFIGSLTGMTPPPIEVAPPEVFKPFRDFTEKVCSIFATPPQRKPLTDEECVRLAKTVAVNKHQIRAIEAAHGIKGEA